MGQEVATPHETLNTLFADRVRRDRTRTALRRKAPSGAYEDVSWGTYGTFATSFGMGLMKLGLLPGDRAAILSNSCLEWLYADMAIIGGGAVSVPIYQNAREEEVAHIVADSRSRVIFLEDAGQLAKLVKAVGLRTLETLEAAIVFQPISDTQRASVEGLRVLTLDELGALDRNGDVQSFDSRGSQVVPDDLATIIYTSGTTGVPKGVMLSHRNCCLQARATNAVFGLNGDDVVLSFLPLAHLIARTPSWRAMLTGCVTVYAPLATALDEMKEARPTAMLCPPRIYEKIHAALQQKVESRSLLERRYLKASVVWAERADERPSPRTSPLLRRDPMDLHGHHRPVTRPAVAQRRSQGMCSPGRRDAGSADAPGSARVC